MRMAYVFSCLVALTSGAAFGQTRGGRGGDVVPIRNVVIPSPQEGGVTRGVIKNAPFSAKQVTEFTQTLRDGTHISNRTEIMLYRDSEGRERREVGSAVTITDPVAGETIRMNTEEKTAVRFPLSLVVAVSTLVGTPISTLNMVPHIQSDSSQGGRGVNPGGAEGAGGRRGGGGAGVGGGRGGPMVPAPVVESLGMKTIEGVFAEGKRTTLTTPQGFIGNDRPIQSVTEQWWSPDLHVYVLTKRTDPRTGDSKTSLVGIQRSDPNPSLFTIPADFTVTNKK